MTNGDYSFDLPPELVAQKPPPERRDSQLLVIDRGGGVVGRRGFAELPDLLTCGDLLVSNDSRVLPARLWTRREDSGGCVELLLLNRELSPSHWSALARPARRLREGLLLAVLDPGTDKLAGPRLRIDLVRPDGVVLVAEVAGGDLVTVAEAHGDIPLPPYIRRDPAAADATDRRRHDRERYQTVYAQAGFAGGASVAAPTAGLHFDDQVLVSLAGRGIAMATVTLNVGPGTFRSPSAKQIASRRLHPESFTMPASTAAAIAACRDRGGRVFAVGTTSLRVLETVARLALPADSPAGELREFPVADEGQVPVFVGRAERAAAGWCVDGITHLFVQPPDLVTACDGLLTNFHLPGSSLLMLVAAFAGDATWRAGYAEAVQRRLRFYSYGDAMLIRPAETLETP